MLHVSDRLRYQRTPTYLSEDSLAPGKRMYDRIVVTNGDEVVAVVVAHPNETIVMRVTLNGMDVPLHIDRILPSS